MQIQPKSDNFFLITIGASDYKENSAMLIL